MAKKQIAPFLAPSKSLIVAGDFCYGYSGIVAVNNVVTELLNMETGRYVIDGKMQFFYSEHVEQDFDYTVKINGVIVTKFFVNDKFDGDLNWFPIIIPPHSTVIMTAQNIVDAATVDQSALFVGRIYDA